MAILAIDEDAIVVRIVYDGPPLSGKTASVNALAQRLTRDVYCPEEFDGRTAYFDWMDYTGGRFEGRQIRCQIVSVPGQRELAERRQWLLRGADAVVFVANTSRDSIEESLHYLQELRTLVGAIGPSTGVVVQAHKCDRSDAVELAAVRQMVSNIDSGMALVESSAVTGTGIRESFVFAVRLALDRVRALSSAGLLQEEATRGVTGKSFFAAMRLALPARSNLGGEPPAARQEATLGPTLQRPTDRAAAPEVTGAQDELPGLLSGVIQESASPTDGDSQPRQDAASNPPPGSERSSAPCGKPVGSVVVAREGPPEPPLVTVPSGAIWPPVLGRVSLHKAAGTRPLSVQRNGGEGMWVAGSGTDWHVMTDSHAVYEDFESGRAALRSWARLHVAASSLLSEQRCIVLAPDRGCWRLWQILHNEPSLLSELRSVPVQSPKQAVAALCDALQMLLSMAERVADSAVFIPNTLRNVGRGATGNPVLVGPMPLVAKEGGRVAKEESVDEQLHAFIEMSEIRSRSKWRRSFKESRATLLTLFDVDTIERVGRLLEA